jgi:hypothetical protein
LIAVSIVGLIYAVLGAGRSLGAYFLGTLVFIGWLSIVVLAFALSGWMVDHLGARFRLLMRRREPYD